MPQRVRLWGTRNPAATCGGTRPDREESRNGSSMPRRPWPVYAGLRQPTGLWIICTPAELPAGRSAFAGHPRRVGGRGGRHPGPRAENGSLDAGPVTRAGSLRGFTGPPGSPDRDAGLAVRRWAGCRAEVGERSSAGRPVPAGRRFSRQRAGSRSGTTPDVLVPVSTRPGGGPAGKTTASSRPPHGQRSSCHPRPTPCPACRSQLSNS